MASKRFHRTSLPLLSLLVILAATQVQSGKKCKGKADVVIVLDSSTSVGDDNWKLQLKFVNNLLSPLSIGSDADRVAFITYNTDAKLNFNLDKYSNYGAIKKAVFGTTFSEGITATGDALKMARTEVLTKARADAAKLVFLVTDGKTNYGVDPIEEAKKIRDAGVWITTVGITDAIDENALKKMSSTGEVATVSEFDELSDLVSNMQKKTCEMKEKKEPPKVKKCDATSKTDVMIVLDSSTSVGDDNWKLELDFVKKLLAPLNVGQDKDRVGFVTYNTDAVLRFGLKKHSSIANVNSAIEGTQFSEGITATGDALEVARQEFAKNGRKGVSKLLFLVTDGKTNFGVDPIAESKKLKTAGVDIITVGITNEIDEKALKQISSKGDVKKVADFDMLKSLVSNIQTETCETKKKCKPTSKAEVVIVLDSSTSVGPDNWDLQLKFVTKLLEPLHIGPDHDRVGFITYNDKTKVNFNLKKYSSLAEVSAAVKSATFSEGFTATGDALKAARTKVLPDARGDVAKIVFLVTDGRNNMGADPIAEAKKLKDSGAKIFTVGITDEVDENALKKISSNNEVAKVKDFSQLSSLVESLGKKTCAAAEGA